MLTFCIGCMFVISLFGEAELAFKCGPDEFPCNDGSCVDKDKWCDSKLDCDDDSDELYCFLRSRHGFIKNPNRCNETLFFLCDNGECIPAIGRCDGYSSCFDNSDEENCGTSEKDSSVSTSWSTEVPIVRNTEKPLETVNGKDFKSLENLHTHENLMQDDALSAIVVRNANISVAESNTSEEHSSSVKRINHSNFQAMFSSSLNNQTNKDSEKSSLASDHQQALDFRSLLGGMVNISRKDTSYVTSETSLNSTSSNKTSSKTSSEVLMNSDVLRDQISESNHPEINVVNGTKSNVADKEKDLEKGYESLNPRNYRNYKDKALHWLINSRNKDYSWGDETARALIAIFMSDYPLGKTNERILMTQQLHLKLFASLSRNETERIPLGELAVYINALSASCNNPKNFYGHDLVNILRYRTNAAQRSSEFVTPFVYLVLCLNDVLFREDVRKVYEMLHNTKISKIDSEAVISLTGTCISRKKEFSNIGLGKMAAKKLYRKIINGNLPTNIYDLALMTQALNEARINQDLWNRDEAMHRITLLQDDKGSFGDILSTYYALPTLYGKSLLWLGKNCPSKNTDLIPVEVLKNGKDEKRFVSYSLRFGNPVKMSQTLIIGVQKNTSFMDIMRIAATINPVYEFKFDMSEGKTFVYSIGGTANDAERGLYWTPYTFSNSTNAWTPLEDDIRSYIPAFGEFMSFWIKPLL